MAIEIQTGVSPYQDFDDLFEKRQAGDPMAPATGIQASYSPYPDISELYLPLSEGAAIANNTGVQNSAGTDCRNLFAAIGTGLNVQAPWNGNNATATANDPTSSGFADARAIFTLLSDGSYTLETTASPSGTSSGDLSGNWLLSGNNSNAEVRFTATNRVTNGQGAIDSDTGWLVLSTTRDFEATATADSLTSNSDTSCTLTVEIRNASTLKVLSTSTVNISLAASVG